MNKWISRGLLLIGYGIPFAFLSMYGDASHDTMLLYGVMIAGFGLLSFGVIKTRQFIMVAVGNAFSVASSCLCMQLLYNRRWDGYFKPFTATGLLLVISMAAFLIQLGFVLRAYKRQQTK